MRYTSSHSTAYKHNRQGKTRQREIIFTAGDVHDHWVIVVSVTGEV
jgi:hypothetical protein